MYNELYHFGILGMRWGVRRYETKDGHLTEAGKSRYRTNKNGSYTSAIEGAASSMSNKHKVSKAVSTADNNVKSVSSELNRTKNLVDNAKNRRTSKVKTNEIAKARKEASEMSDEELKKKVKRMNLEQQYKDLKTKDIDNGQDKVYKALDIAGDVLAVGLTAANLYMMIRKGKVI